MRLFQLRKLNEKLIFQLSELENELKNKNCEIDELKRTIKNNEDIFSNQKQLRIHLETAKSIVELLTNLNEKENNNKHNY